MIHNFPQLFQLHSSSHQNNSLHSHCPRHLMPTHKLTKFSISQLTFHISSQLHDVAHRNGKESQLKAITIFSTRLGRMQTGKTSKYACTSWSVSFSRFFLSFFFPPLTMLGIILWSAWSINKLQCAYVLIKLYKVALVCSRCWCDGWKLRNVFVKTW